MKKISKNFYSHSKTEISKIFKISWTELGHSMKKIQKMFYSHTKTKIFKICLYFMDRHRPVNKKFKYTYIYIYIYIYIYFMDHPGSLNKRLLKIFLYLH